MRDDDTERVRPSPTTHVLGCDLSAVSLDELGQRILLLEAEIARIREEERRKRASRDAAGAFFKS